MKKINLKKFLVFLSLLLFFFGYSQVSAADLGGLENTASGVGYKQVASGKAGSAIATKIGGIINAVLGLISVIFLTLIFMGSFDITSSGGNEEAVKRGRMRIKTGAIGVLIIFSAFLVSKLFLFFLADAAFKANGGIK
ncbi:MAG: hypothetical protein UT48_C0029G0009 [Parcubacteria group bacterium GW2011_GWE2_39_37]|uniref:Uncharacterized protein n=1 Tax=Candidatus Falkowbacteria bacterium GW2011_GWF2_39_8 TaxID=1618642 RepID=A0A0G0Q0S0_9BACT|nr:MAG: hypothetical protein UT48_C0029G0009 [Parcubacteria group bacterium GW2011_GWE2_39_37]KKR33944.1 MAG: hypothetical protein UT64_C0001G0018 [Candidatus Falkowbacteria bacterium GW2011_GWF2_39_8]